MVADVRHAYDDAFGYPLRVTSHDVHHAYASAEWCRTMCIMLMMMQFKRHYGSYYDSIVHMLHMTVLCADASHLSAQE